jgi:curved DNA-binding protein CbpA
MLGLTSQASISEIEEAFTKLRIKYLQLLETGIGLVGEKKKAEIDLQLLQLAYQALVDQNRRSRYDQLLPERLKTWDNRISKESNVCNWWGAKSWSHVQKPEIEIGRSTNRDSMDMQPLPAEPIVKSAFSKMRPPRPVAELIKKQRGILYNLKRLIFGY